MFVELVVVFFLKNGFGHFKSPLFNHHLGKILFQPTQANLSLVGLFFRCSIFLFVFYVLLGGGFKDFYFHPYLWKIPI